MTHIDVRNNYCARVIRQSITRAVVKNGKQQTRYARSKPAGSGNDAMRLIVAAADSLQYLTSISIAINVSPDDAFGHTARRAFPVHRVRDVSRRPTNGPASFPRDVRNESRSSKSVRSGYTSVSTDSAASTITDGSCPVIRTFELCLKNH